MLEIDRLVKHFGGTVALNGLSLRAAPGEIVGVAGPNGAGKSTLVHVLAGETPEDSGTVSVDGSLVPFRHRPEFVSVVHQELQLFPTLTVLENLLIGADGSRFFRPRPSAKVLALAREFGLSNVADRPLDSCSLVVRQLTEIARAMLHEKRVVLLDEPNSALTAAESDRLFNEVQRLRGQGTSIIILVSHRLADLERYCDRVLIVREGMGSAELQGSHLTTRELAQAIVGGGAAATAAGPGAADESRENSLRGSGPKAERPVVEVHDWSDPRADAFRGIDLVVAPGESLFITGQEDGGGRELLRSIAGLTPATGTVATLPNAAGGSAAYLPGSRASSLFPNLSVKANLCVRLNPRTLGGRTGLLRRGLMSERAAFWVNHLEIRTPSLLAPIGVLSGGTQQKVAIGAALAAQPRLLIVEDPTRGVDIRTRQQIVTTLRSWVQDGNAILAFSPELDEVFELADVVHVAASGRLSEPLEISRQVTLEGLARWVDQCNLTDRNAIIPSGSGARVQDEEAALQIAPGLSDPPQQQAGSQQ